MLGTRTRGGKRPGAGRPQKATSPIELERALIKKTMDQRIMRSTDRLINAQISIASGLSFLYVIRKDEKGKEKRPELVEDQETIEAYLAGELEGDPSQYYYITTKEPQNIAIDSLINRVHGKPTESIELSGQVDFRLSALHTHAMIPAQSAEGHGARSAIPGEVLRVIKPEDEEDAAR